MNENLDLKKNRGFREVILRMIIGKLYCMSLYVALVNFRRLLIISTAQSFLTF